MLWKAIILYNAYMLKRKKKKNCKDRGKFLVNRFSEFYNIIHGLIFPKQRFSVSPCLTAKYNLGNDQFKFVCNREQMSLSTFAEPQNHDCISSKHFGRPPKDN